MFPSVLALFITMVDEIGCSKLLNRLLYSRCSPSRVYTVLSSLNYDMREVIKEMGFGILLGMKKYKLRLDLIYWLVERFDPIDGSIQVVNEKLNLNSQIFAKTIGVFDGGEDIGDIIMEEKCKRVSSSRLVISKLQQTLEKNEEAELFVRNFLLFVAGTFLIPSTSLYVLRSFEELVKELNDVTSAKSKNWASMSWRYLVEGIRRFKQGRSNYVCGCIFFLQVIKSIMFLLKLVYLYFVLD